MKDRVAKYGAWALLGLIFLMLVFLNIFYQDHWLDSDMAAEMMFSRLLAEEGHIFATPSWYYSTEFRFLYTHLVMGPLFHIFGSWHVIRTITNVVFYVLLLLSYFYFIKPFRLSGTAVALTAVLLLLPFSETMMTHMQMGNTYMSHVIIVFFFFGMYLRLAYQKPSRGWTRWLLLGCYLLLGLICGVSGVRYLLELQCPLALTALIYLLKSGEFQNFRREPGRENGKRLLSCGAAPVLGYSVLGAAAGVAGYGVNVLWVSRQYVFQTYGATNFIAIYQGVLFERLQNAIGTLLMLFGYIPERGFLSLRGLITMIAFVMLAVFVYSEVRSLKRCSGMRSFVALFLMTAFFLNVFVFVFTTSTMVSRYYITIFIFLLPVMAFYMETEKLKFDRGIVTLVLAGCLFLATAKTVFSFVTVDKNEDKRAVAAYLADNGYDFGFATYNNGNIITELTDGEIEIANIGDPEFLDYFKWSSPTRYYEEGYHEGEVFLLLTTEEFGQYAETETVRTGAVIYEDGSYTVLVYDSVEQLMNCAAVRQ